MGWKATMRSLEAASRRREREAQRQRRDLVRQGAQVSRMLEQKRAEYEVALYENQIELFQSVHKQCSDPMQWEALMSAAPPVQPERKHSQEQSAQAALDRYKPGAMDKLMRRVESTRTALTEALVEARKEDEAEYERALQVYQEDYAEWQACRELASQVLAGNTDAYLDAIRQTEPFSDVQEIGAAISYVAQDATLVEASLHVCAQDVIPSEVKSLLKNGKLSVKKMPVGQFNGLYQDYVCGCALRVAREMFALLPIKMVIVTAVSSLLNAQTGYQEDKPILSVAIPRDTIEKLNFSMLDPSDSMRQFVHRMEFSATKGFRVVDAITASDLKVE